MNLTYSFIAIVAILLIAGCEPKVVYVEKEVVSPEPIVEITDYVVLNEPWNRYFRSKPKILIVPQLSEGIADLLEQEQTLIKSVLDSGGSANASSEYITLEDKLEELKTVIPQTGTSTGYVPRYRRYSSSGTYTSGSNVYINDRYYSGYYAVLRYKTMSSSPEMTRSVENVAHNATLDGLDQRIDALQQILRSWRHKTSIMSTTGTSGVMRRANLAYLEDLAGFTQEFVKLRQELRDINQRQDAIQRNKTNILSEWKAFEDTRLPLLEEYLQSNASDTVSASPSDVYILNDYEGKRILYACEIGERTLYFDLSNKHSSKHPFVLVDVAPVESSE
ncbi:MAG: hypothetical protein ACSHX8_02420 [Opitutaceae bacterium]